jgi:hypothetical protein
MTCMDVIIGTRSRMVIRNSGSIIRLATVRTRAQRTARNVIGATAMKVGPVARKVAGGLSGVGIGYPAPRGAHALTGRRAADVSLASREQPEKRLYELLRGGTFVLLAPGRLRPVAEPWSERVRFSSPAQADTPITLVRPDGYVAWATDQTDPQRGDDEVRNALAAHCGPATVGTASVS